MNKLKAVIIRLALGLTCLGLWPATAAWADEEFVLLDPQELTEKFETSLRVLKEHLDTQEPPKFMLYKAELTFSKSNGLDGLISGKIPVLVFTAEVTGKYQDIATTTEKLTYVPAASVPVNFDDSGVVAFLTRVHEKLRDQIDAQSLFVVSRAEYDYDFFIKLDGEGKMTFLSLASIGGGVDLKNAHKFKFYFCLLGNDGECVGG